MGWGLEGMAPWDMSAGPQSWFMSTQRGDATVDAIQEVEAALAARRERLPAGAEHWLRAHPRAAARLHREVLALADDQYIEYRFRVTADSWAGDEVGAQERVRDELAMSMGHFSVRWAGRWRVVTMDPDTREFLLQR